MAAGTLSCVIRSSPTSIGHTKLPSHTSSVADDSTSPPSSPHSSRSSLSLEPLTSSPSSSAGCLNTEFTYTHLLAASSSYLDTDIPTLLDTPSPATASLSVSSHHSLKSRVAVCQLEDYGGLRSSVPGSKRQCDNMDAEISADSASSFSSIDQLPAISHRDEMFDNGAEYTGITAFGDFDDVLDLLLQDSQATPAVRIPATASPEPVYAWNREPALKENAELAETKLGCPVFAFGYEQSCSRQGNGLTDWSLQASVEFPQVASCYLPQHNVDIDASQDFSGKVRAASSDSAVSYAAGSRLRNSEEQKPSIVSPCEEWLREKPSSIVPLSGFRGAQQEATQLTQSSVTSGRGSRWAGPTLMDIESALAMTSPPSPTTSTSKPSFPPSSPFAKRPMNPTSYLCSIKEILKQEKSPFLATSSLSCKEEPTILEEDDRMATWRRLQKRNQMEPRYTVRIRSEEDAVKDGYRWRKYGQKSIKNSPYPRSYYRCSSGKCNVKKQVERSSEDAGVVVVSYEGIHLHHRPTSLHSCGRPPPPAPTCERALPPSITPTAIQS